LAKQTDILEQTIARCCQYKADIVARDETELGERALLNFGHTFGHALEVLFEYRNLVHGEAVAIGMVLAAEFSAACGLAEHDDAKRLKQLLQQLGLPTQLPTGLDAGQLLDKMHLDKKARHGQLHLVLWRGIGQACQPRIVDADEVLHFLQKIMTL
jgi:3-dehydroquinate synthase